MHITLTGNLGSGKSTLSKILENQYGYEIFSTGKVIRQIASDHGVSVLEMNKLMEKDHKYDHEIDDTTARIARENPNKNILFDSRLAWNFVEKSFKVFLSSNSLIIDFETSSIGRISLSAFMQKRSNIPCNSIIKAELLFNKYKA